MTTTRYIPEGDSVDAVWITTDDGQRVMLCEGSNGDLVLSTCAGDGEVLSSVQLMHGQAEALAVFMYFWERKGHLP